MTSPRRLPGPAFRAAGGSVVSRSGQEVVNAAPLLRLLAQAATGQRQCGDRAAAKALAQMALELAEALAGADDWRRAALGLGRSAPAPPELAWQVSRRSDR